GRMVAPPPAKVTAERLGISVHQPEKPELPGPVDTVVVCAYGLYIPPRLLEQALWVNVHPSLLPRWRGAAPVERAIMAGDERTGVSIMRVTAGLDSGPVCLAQEEPIQAQDTYGSLSVRLQRLSTRVLVEALDLLKDGQALLFAEQDDAKATYAEKIAAPDRLLDPSRPAVELERVVRALHPHIGARLALPDGAFLGVRRAVCVEPDTTPPGAGLYAGEQRLLLACSPGTLELLEVQPPGGRPMDAASYLRGHAG
ncbi:MAG: methionyl-tRNA formyltransferase, partial [Solirubrobacteraceae bacterium]